jgi:hypothetical protein
MQGGCHDAVHPQACGLARHLVYVRYDPTVEEIAIVEADVV